jgi:hypothetical protein
MELFGKSIEYAGNQNSRFKKLLDVIPDLLAVDGWVITFGYHSRVMGTKRGFVIREVCLISHGGSGCKSLWQRTRDTGTVPRVRF